MTNQVCPTCQGRQFVLHFYARGPSDPPGNQLVPCPTCKGVCAVAARVADEIRERAEGGLSKYGVTVADAKLTRRQWLQHAKEECLDQAIYLQKLIDMEDDDES